VAPSSAPNAIARAKLLHVKDATHLARAFSPSARCESQPLACRSLLPARAAAPRVAVLGPAGHDILRFLDSPLHQKRLQAPPRPVPRVRPAEHPRFRAGKAISSRPPSWGPPA
jgi:hypothetical protein